MKKVFILSIAILSIVTTNAQKVGVGTTISDSLLPVAGSTHLSGNTLINGTTTTTNLKLPTGAGAGKVLQSDAGGNASWVISSFV